MFDQIIATIQDAFKKVVAIYERMIQVLREIADKLEGYVPTLPEDEDVTE